MRKCRNSLLWHGESDITNVGAMGLLMGLLRVSALVLLAASVALAQEGCEVPPGGRRVGRLPGGAPFPLPLPFPHRLHLLRAPLPLPLPLPAH